MLCKHAELGRMMGVAPNNIVIAENGRVIELSRKSVKAEDSVPAGRVFVDGAGAVSYTHLDVYKRQQVPQRHWPLPL